MCFFIIARLKMQVYLCNCRFVTALKSYRVNTLFRDYRKSLSRSHSRSLSLARSFSLSLSSLSLSHNNSPSLMLGSRWNNVEAMLCNAEKPLYRRCATLIQSCFNVGHRRCITIVQHCSLFTIVQIRCTTYPYGKNERTRNNDNDNNCYYPYSQIIEMIKKINPSSKLLFIHYMNDASHSRCMICNCFLVVIR